MSRWIMLPLLVSLGCNKQEPADGVPAAGSSLTMTTPEPASWWPAGTIAAEGTAAGVTEVTLNGVAVDRAGTSWSGEVELVRGIQAVELSATEADGDTRFLRYGVIAGDFVAPGEPVGSAVAVRVNESGLDKALDYVASQFDAASLETLLLSANPVYEYYSWAVDLIIDVVSVSFDDPQIEVEPRNGYLELTVVVPNLDVVLSAFVDTAIDFTAGAGGGADQAVLVAKAVLGTDGNGALTVEITEVEVSFVGFYYNISFITDYITDVLFVDTIQGFLEDTLTTAILDQVPPLIEETLAGLDLSFQTELLGKELTVAADFSDAGVDGDGAWVDVDIDVNVPQGSTVLYQGVLDAPDVAPEPDRSADLSAALSDDLMNRILFEVWRGGILELTLSTEDGSLEPFLLSQFQAEEGSIATFAHLPPVVVEEKGELIAQIGEMEVVIETPGGGLGERLVLSITGSIPLEAGVTNGELTLELGSPALAMSVRETDWNASHETITHLLEENLPIDTLLMLFGEFSFPLPTLGDLAIGTAEVDRDASTFHTDVGATLE